MKLPESLIKNFITSEFSPKLNSSGEYIIHSPFCNDKKGKCYINSNGQWMDFKGGDSGGFMKFVMLYLDMNYYDALQYLVTNYNLEAPQKTEEEVKQESTNKELLKEFICVAKPKLFGDGNNLTEEENKAYQYILDRKIESYFVPKLGICRSKGTIYDNRIFIPFYENEKIVYGITRSLKKDDKLRYVNIPKLNSKEYVFNIDNVIDSCVICEGTMDSMSMVEDMGAISMLSADLGVKQMEKLFDREVKQIIYCPDTDCTGKATMDRNIKKLIQYCPYSGLEIYVYEIPGGYKDFNELKIATGKNYILKKECYKYGDKLFERKFW